MRLWSAIQAFWRELKGEEKPSVPLLGEGENKEKGKEDFSHLRLLSLMQKSGRLIDFLKEDLSSYDDAAIGASVRPIHQELSKLVEEMVAIRKVLDEEEGSTITVPVGYDSQKIKVIGKVAGEPPYVGSVVHQGWKAHKRSLPKVTGQTSFEIIAPAEVEVK